MQTKSSSASYDFGNHIRNQEKKLNPMSTKSQFPEWWKYFQLGVLGIFIQCKKLQKRQKTLEEQAQLSRQTSERKTSLRKTFGDSQRDKKRDNAFAEVKIAFKF